MLQYQEKKKTGVKTEVSNYANYTRITAEATQFEQNFLKRLLNVDGSRPGLSPYGRSEPEGYCI